MFFFCSLSESVDPMDASVPKKPRRTQSGETTSNVVMSSHYSDNSEVFPEILKLFVPEGSRIADVTYGTGVFWRNVDTSKYDFLPSDLKTGVDCRNLPYDDASLDALVFDPPYMEGFYRKDESNLAGDGSHGAFRRYYSDGKASEHSTLKYHDRVVDMYMTVPRQHP
jgi:hypothetical protein